MKKSVDILQVLFTASETYYQSSQKLLKKLFVINMFIFRIISSWTRANLAFDQCTAWLNDSNGPITTMQKDSSAIGALKCIRSLISQSTTVQIYNTSIQPHFDYCAPVWDGLNSYLCGKLRQLQNRAARVILQACEVNSILLLEILKWDQLSLRKRKHKSITMFKSLNRVSPRVLTWIIQ